MLLVFRMYGSTVGMFVCMFDMKVCFGILLRVLVQEPIFDFGRPAFPSIFKLPGDDLLSHKWTCSTIGAKTFHYRVRDGIGWFHHAMDTRELKDR